MELQFQSGSRSGKSGCLVAGANDSHGDHVDELPGIHLGFGAGAVQGDKPIPEKKDGNEKGRKGVRREW